MGIWKEEYSPIAAMVSLEFIYAISNNWSKQALLGGLPASVFVFYNQVCATLVTFPIAYFIRDKSSNARMELRTFMLLLITTFIGGPLFQDLNAKGLYLASASVASAMYNLVPPVTFLMAAILGWEEMNVKKLSSIAKILGTILCAGGATLMTFLRGQKLLNDQHQLPHTNSLPTQLLGSQSWLIGCLLLLASICCCSLRLILQVPILKSYPDYLSLSVWMCFLSMLQTGMVALFSEHDLKAWALNSNVEVGACLFSGIFSIGIQSFILCWCVLRRGPLFTAAFSPLSTVLTTFFASIIFHEGVYIGTLLGAVGAIIGLYAVLWGKAEEMKKKIDLEPRNSPPSITREDDTNCGINLEEPLCTDA